jgi:hypothetical protein
VSIGAAKTEGADSRQPIPTLARPGYPLTGNEEPGAGKVHARVKVLHVQMRSDLAVMDL